MEFLTDHKRGINDAIVAHLVLEGRGPGGEQLKLCNGEVYDHEAVRDYPGRQRVFCAACQLLALTPSAPSS